MVIASGEFEESCNRRVFLVFDGGICLRKVNRINRLSLSARPYKTQNGGG